MSLMDMTARLVAESVKQGELSAVTVLEAALERISAVDGRPGSLDVDALSEDDKNKVHAFITLTKDRAYQQAQDVDRRVSEGEDPGPLAGVPSQSRISFA